MSVYIICGVRTPSGTFMGPLSQVSAPKLGAVAIKGAIQKAKIDAKQIDEVFMGQVVTAGSGQAPARQAAIFSGLSHHVPATTVNKVCGSGMQAVILASQSIESGENQLVVAGGMENMSMAPFLIPNMRQGNKFGEGVIKDSLQWDGLWDVYSNRAMGNCAEECAKVYNISRSEQDSYAIESFKRSQRAIKDRIFAGEVAPVEIENRKGKIVVSEDDGPMKANFEKIPTLSPVFSKEGTITAANASSINDGAAALIIAGENLKNFAKFKIVSYAKYAQDPTWFTTSPVEAMKNCLAKAKLKLEDIDIFEINEAFALVPLFAMKELKLDHNRVNVYGGGIGLGHPIGCSGARIIVTLMSALQNKNGKRGMASICIGGGEALAIIIERMN